jgi:hypothetical protein
MCGKSSWNWQSSHKGKSSGHTPGLMTVRNPEGEVIFHLPMWSLWMFAVLVFWWLPKLLPFVLVALGVALLMGYRLDFGHGGSDKAKQKPKRDTYDGEYI